MNFRKWNNKGVSPVIATILMVAITVVLAAVLYVMVIGFGGGTAKPTVGFLPADKTSSTVYKLTVSDVSPSDLDLSKYKIMITMNGTTTCAAAQTLTTTVTAAAGKPAWLTISFTDLTGNSKLNKGDYFTFTSSVAYGTGMTFEVKLIWGADDSELGAKSFTT